MVLNEQNCSETVQNVLEPLMFIFVKYDYVFIFTLCLNMLEWQWQIAAAYKVKNM